MISNPLFFFLMTIYYNGDIVIKLPVINSFDNVIIINNHIAFYSSHAHFTNMVSL